MKYWVYIKGSKNSKGKGMNGSTKIQGPCLTRLQQTINP